VFQWEIWPFIKKINDNLFDFKISMEYCQVKSTNYETISSKGKLNIVYFITLCDHLTCGYHIQIAIKALSTAVKNINLIQ
jgi:hypothetical protein